MMAEQLALVVRDDFTADIAVLDLLAWRARDSWQMAIGDGEAPVDEALLIHVPGTSDDDLAANIQALDAMLVRVQHFLNPVEPYGVWLRHQLAGETGARQALILEAKRDKAQVSDLMIREHYLRDYMLGLKRTSAWEDTGYREWYAEGLGTLGGMADLGYVRGDVAARLARVRIDGRAWVEPLTKVWIGFRSDRFFGNPGLFTPRWEIEFGTMGTGAAVTGDNDATAIGGAEHEYAGETPALSSGSNGIFFGVLHSPVKPGSITLVATIDGIDYTLTDTGTGEVLSTGTATTDLELDPGLSGTLEHQLITPGSLYFMDGEIIEGHDNGAGTLRGPVSHAESATGTSGRLTNTSIITPGSVIVSSDVPEALAHDDSIGGLLDETETAVGTIDYVTGDWTYTGGGTVGEIAYNTTENVGTIDYATGDWTYTGGGVPHTAAYEYGFVYATFDYNLGICTFPTADVTAVTITYTSYINRSVRVTFTDPTWQPRWSMSVSDASPHPEAQAGKMLVIGRFKMSDGSTVCRVRLESGFSESRTYHNHSKVVVEGDAWTLYPLGYVTFPEAGRARATLDAIMVIGQQRLRLSADLYAGSGTLEMDCLLMIPVDEGLIEFEGNTEPMIVIDPLRYPVMLTQSADNKVRAIGSDENGVALYTDMAPQVLEGMPTGGNVHVVCAAQRYHESIRFDTIDLSIAGYERWLTLRGAE
jgi:hypothetical protein